MKTDISVLLPTYNERDNLPIVFALLYKSMTQNNLKYEVIVIDDASPDGTADVALRLLKAFPEIKGQLIQRPGKLGLGTAYIAGLKKVTSDLVVLMDADLSHHPKYIPLMLKELRTSGADVVAGTRYAMGGGTSGWDFKRVLISNGGNFLVKCLLDPPITDVTSSFRLYKRSAIEEVIPQVISKGYVFQMEIVIKLHRSGKKFSEVPIIFVDRMYGVSKLGADEFTQFFKGLLKLAFLE